VTVVTLDGDANGDGAGNNRCDASSDRVDAAARQDMPVVLLQV